MRWRLEEALRAGESGRYFGLEVRMNVYGGDQLEVQKISPTHIRILVIYTAQCTGM